MAFIGFITIRFLSESKEYKQSKPIADVNTATSIYPYVSVLCIGGGIGGMFYYCISYVPVLLQQLNNAASIGAQRSLLLLLYGFAVLLGGVMCDTLERGVFRRITHLGLSLCIIGTISSILLSEGKAYSLVYIGLLSCAGGAHYLVNTKYRPYIDVVLSSSLLYYSSFPGLCFILLFALPSLLSTAKSSDGAIPVMVYSCVAAFILTTFAFNDVVSFHSLYLHSILVLLVGIFVGPSHKLMNDLFPPNKRYQSISLCYGVGTAVMGGSATFLCMKLWSISKTLPPFFMILCTGISGLAMYAAWRTKLEARVG